MTTQLCAKYIMHIQFSCPNNNKLEQLVLYIYIRALVLDDFVIIDCLYDGACM